MFGEANMKLQPNSRIAYPVSDSQTRTKVSVQGASAWPGHKE